jgi:glycosyltransferase involved in cell wall biosynthesis
VLENLDILVHASITPEPFGQVILEGMAKGVPVVAADAGGIREILTNRKTGLLVPPGDAPALADELLSLFSDAERRSTIGKAGYEHVCQNFRSSKTARAVEAVYRNVLPSPHRHSKQKARLPRRTLTQDPAGASRRLPTSRFFRYLWSRFLC